MSEENKRTLTRAIKKKAHQVGFQLVGVTTPEPPPHLDVYARWLENGYHAEMDWIASQRAQERRADPLLILPECKSILVAGIRYPIPDPELHQNYQQGGKIGSYAWGDDYHDDLPERLSTIVQFIEEQIGNPIPTRWYTDTGPILEREMAQRAGLGWIGKNTCLIHPKFGSGFLLAEILLGIELQIDEPILKDFCGTCTRCLDHCPTGCITPDRMIDANRCISYLTIEHKGFIPMEIRPLIGTWIFGCDVCQQVCPWNKKLSYSNAESLDESIYDDLFSPRLGLPPTSLIEELALTPQDFNRKFKGSPIKRAKRRGYLRNVAIALGNSRDEDAIPALLHALRDNEPLIRGHACWALGRIGGVESVEGLKLALLVEENPEVGSEIQAALANITA